GDRTVAGRGVPRRLWIGVSAIRLPWQAGTHGGRLCRCAISSRLREVWSQAFLQGLDFVLDRNLPGEGPPRLPVPVARVGEVAFHEVHYAMRPARGRRGFVLLHDLVRRFPVSSIEELQSFGELARLQLHAICGGGLMRKLIDKGNCGGRESPGQWAKREGAAPRRTPFRARRCWWMGRMASSAA